MHACNQIDDEPVLKHRDDQRINMRGQIMEAEKDTSEIDHYTVLSAIWVFACNDERALISYRGIRHRLSLPTSYPVEEIIRDRAELFRLRAPLTQLAAYKEFLRSGQKGPSWLALAKSREEKLQMIDGLEPEDFFRSQFRTEPDAPRSSLEILKWGLEHIERLRTKDVQKNEDRHKRVTAIWIPAGSLLATILALIVSSCMQWNAADRNADLQVFETTYQPRQEGYATLMRALWSTFQVASGNDQVRADSSLAALETMLFELEPVMAEGTREAIWKQYRTFEAFCRQIANGPAQPRATTLAQFTVHRREMAELLHKSLFESALTRWAPRLTPAAGLHTLEAATSIQERAMMVDRSIRVSHVMARLRTACGCEACGEAVPVHRM
jgi:hypothetical protein